MSTNHRIDVHQHAVRPFWAKALPTHGGDPSGAGIPEWAPESAIAFMDSQEIATGILSLTAPSVVGWDQSERREMARRVNEYTADLAAKRPDRFGNFATPPLPDVDGALRELEYALDTLRADGVILLSTYAGKYLGDAVFEPVWTELGRRQAVVFVHPGQPPLPTAAGLPGPLVDYPFDTTRTAVQLVLNGIVDRYPGAASSSRTPAASCLTPRIASPSSRASSVPAQRIRPTFSRRFSASISTRRCHRDLRFCRASRLSPELAASCSAAISRTHPPTWARPSPPS
jgi:Amidohydrolase